MKTEPNVPQFSLNAKERMCHCLSKVRLSSLTTRCRYLPKHTLHVRVTDVSDYALVLFLRTNKLLKPSQCAVKF